MIDVITAMDSRRDRASLMLLSKFSRPEAMSDLGSYWDEALGESRVAVVQRFVDQGLVEPAPLHVKLDLKLKVTELNSLLKKKGLKCSGRKAELINRLIEHDSESIQKMAGRWWVFQCSNAGRALALEYEAAVEAERNQAETDVLALIMNGDYRNASLRMSSFEAKQVFWRGFNVDWANHDPEIDVETLDFIFTGWPEMLKHVDPDLKGPLRFGAAMMQLFAEARADKWFEELPVTESHLDPNTVMRMICFYGKHQRDMQEFKRMKVRKVEIHGGDDEESCPHCAAISGKKFPLGKVPELPLATCTSECGCRCLALACDFGP